MDIDIKTIEDLSLNAWPSHQMQVYDGWILRFSHFYTHRTNCVEPIGASMLPLSEKIPYCEGVYRHWHSPCIFKISPIADPDLDGILDRRGYHIEHEVDVMALPLSANAPFEATSKAFHITNAPIAPALEAFHMANASASPTPEALSANAKASFSSPPGLILQDRVDNDWLDGLFRLKRMADPVHHRIVPAMYAAIPMNEVAARIERDGRVIATGLGILDRGHIGIYAIHVSEDHRRQGLARAVVLALLAEGERRGAKRAYLQVVADNAPAKNLYRSLGFRRAYGCHFRVKNN